MCICVYVYMCVCVRVWVHVSTGPELTWLCQRWLDQLPRTAMVKVRVRARVSVRVKVMA